MNEITTKNTCIMFTDVVGYTAMMEHDELQTFQIILRLRKILEEVHLKYSGNLLQFIGDGSLGTFDSADDAITAALAIRNKIPALLDIHLRIGIHYGTIIQDGINTCGHAINLASRIEDSAAEDSILLSQSLVDQLTNASEYRLVSQGDFQFKNVRQSLELYSLEEDDIFSNTAVMTEKVPVGFLTRWSSYFASVIFLILFGVQITAGKTSSSDSETSTAFSTQPECGQAAVDQTPWCCDLYSEIL